MHINVNDLLAGDVLLYRPQKPNVVQKKISAATNSPYTHAAIYIGDGTIAESVAWPCLIGVRKQSVQSSLKRSLCVGVLRTQCGFGKDRATKLTAFVEEVVRKRKFYDLIAARKFPSEGKHYFDNQISFIRDNYGKIMPDEKFSKKNFFCSALVVACYSVVGIIGETAQVAYPPELFSPAGLYRDPTFGWLLGHMIPEGGSVPIDDPILVEATQWSQNQNVRWWP